MTVIVGNFFNLFLESWVAACLISSGSLLYPSIIPTEKENCLRFVLASLDIILLCFFFFLKLVVSGSDVNMGALQGLLLRSDQTDSVISELVQKLMYGMSTWESDEVSWSSSRC